MGYQRTLGNNQALSYPGANLALDFPHGHTLDHRDLLDGRYDITQFGAQILSTAFD